MERQSQIFNVGANSLDQMAYPSPINWLGDGWGKVMGSACIGVRLGFDFNLKKNTNSLFYEHDTIIQ